MILLKEYRFTFQEKRILETIQTIFSVARGRFGDFLGLLFGKKV